MIGKNGEIFYITDSEAEGEEENKKRKLNNI